MQRYVNEDKYNLLNINNLNFARITKNYFSLSKRTTSCVVKIYNFFFLYKSYFIVLFFPRFFLDYQVQKLKWNFASHKPVKLTKDH